LGQGHIRTRTIDYYRQGTVTLFAALDYLSCKVIATSPAPSRHQEWLAFLRKIDKEVAPKLELHIICDNYSIHKHAKVTAWLAPHPRFHLHFIPTSSSWLNLVDASLVKSPPKSSAREAFAASEPWSPTSSAFWMITIAIPNPTAGPQTPTASLKKSIALGRPYSKKYTILFTGLSH
jgi:hypothetical protein